MVTLGSLSVREGKPQTGKLVSQRPAAAKRKFISQAVEATIERTQKSIKDERLAWMFANCFPNTLDTTVNFTVQNGKPDTFVITGDIDAMWLRDSSAQVWPYLPLMKEDGKLQQMIEGVIRRQARCIAIDPYANAFLPSATSKPLSWSTSDHTEHRPGVGERKWEVDSLCYPIRLSYGYWKATGSAAPFEEEWRHAMRVVVQTFREQQRKNGPGPYQFQRQSLRATETLALDGYGNPARPVGMIFSMFRPSDDACLFPLFVPANLFAATSLRQLAEIHRDGLKDTTFAEECTALANEVEAATRQYGQIKQGAETFWAYEADGYGNQLFIDDANAPGLLSLPYLGYCAIEDPVYQATRKRVLSDKNPYFFQGSAGAGIGGPHEGLDMIWPMSIIMQAFTSNDDAEIKQCLAWLKTTDADSGFMHESFQKDNPQKFTRSWFAWANTLFGELILHLNRTKPNLLA